MSDRPSGEVKLVGAVSDVPGRAHGLALRVAQLTARGEQTIVSSLYRGARTSLFCVRRPENSLEGLIAVASPDGSDHFWVSGESIGDDVRRPNGFIDFDDEIERLREDLEGEFVGVRIDSTERITLWIDSWGLAWVLVRRLSDAIVFGSDFAAMCSLDERLTVDRDSVLLELAMGYSPDERTVFKEVEFVSPGALVRIDPTGVNTLAEARFKYGDRWFGASMQSKFEALDGHFERMGDRIARLAGGHAAISLSAGYDSRYALARLSAAGAVGKLLTFGDPESEEVVEAHAVAARHADPPDWEVFRVPETSWESWASMIQSLGNAGIVQWCGWSDAWLAFVRRHAQQCVIGYLGDALSGKRFDVLPNEDDLAGELDVEFDLWTKRWMAFELDMGEWGRSRLLRRHARQELLRAQAERFRSLAAKASCSEAFQQALHCNLVGRQRRWVGTQPVLLRAYVKPLTFFVDKAYRDFWMNVGLDDLLEQRLYLRYAELRYPRFFPRPPGAALMFGKRASRKLRQGLSSILGHEPPPKRPPPISRVGLLAPHLHRIRDIIDTVRPELEDVVDLDAVRRSVATYAAGGADSSVTTTMLFRFVNVSHLLVLNTRRSGAAS